MKKISLALVMLIVCFLIPVISAQIIVDEEMILYEDTGGFYNYPLGSGSTTQKTNAIAFNEISEHTNLAYVIIESPKKPDILFAEGRTETTYTLDGVTKPAVVYVSYDRNLVGSIINYRMIFFPQEWDVSGKSGKKTLTIAGWTFKNSGYRRAAGNDPVFWIVESGNTNQVIPVEAFSIMVASTKDWRNHLTVSDYLEHSYKIELKREYESGNYASTLQLLLNSELIITDTKGSDVEIYQLKNRVDTIKVLSGETTYSWSLDASTSDSTPVTVYVRNSQTNALLANAHINISANVNGNFHEIVNETVPSGIYSSEMQPTGGGMPNPDYYRLWVTLDGYNSQMPYIDFEFDEAATIYTYLDPIGGAPEDENNTFIDFFVRDMSSNPISGATVNFGGYTLITNSAGYTIFEVDKSKTYTWTVSKSGYGSLTGNAVIGDDPRHTINTVLAPAVTPTTPTAIPTSTPISPTPTMTAPNGEPTSNLLEWFAAHFGMILGGGVEIGKIFMWLCFAVPVGVYVGKEAKAGAAGFMAGAGIVTLFFVLIGWVPIWLLVLLALIIGLLYAKVFNNSDNGGGR